MLEKPETKRPMGLILRVCLLLLPIAGCQTIQFDRPAVLTDADWIVDGKTQERARSIDSYIELPLSIVWEYNAAGAFGPGSPLILDEVVLAPTLKGEIHTIELETGRKMGFKSFGEAIEGSPVIDNGILFVPSAWGKRTLFAYDLKRGTFKWKYAGVPFETTLLLHENFVIGVDVEGVVQAFDQDTGDTAWRFELGERVSVQSSPLMLAGGQLFVATDSGIAFLIAADDGHVIWKTTLSGPVYASSSSNDGVITVPTTRGVVDALDADTGRILWSFSVDNSGQRFSSISMWNDLVFVGSTDRKMRALSVHDGSVRWIVQLPDVIIAAPLPTAESVFVGTMGKRLYAFEKESGNLLWETELRGRVKSAMAAVSGGILVLSEPRYVTFFRFAEEGHEN